MIKIFGKLAVVLIAAPALVLSCGTSGGDTAILSFSLTDAPDTGDLTNVFITVSSLEVNENQDGAFGEDGSWKVIALNPAKEYDLLTLTSGVREEIGELEITGGTRINQIRFVVDTAGVSKDEGLTITPLVLPSGEIKLVNSFQVPLSGTLGITLDFDVRKSVIKTGEGTYSLKPAIRVILDNEAGWIPGTTNPGAFVYLYKDGDYVEGIEPDAADPVALSPAFPNAYSSTVANETTGEFKLAFIDPGVYDIVILDGSAHEFFDLDLTVEADSPAPAGDLTITI